MTPDLRSKTHDLRLAMRWLVAFGVVGVGICALLALFAARSGNPAVPVVGTSTATVAVGAGAQRGLPSGTGSELDITYVTSTLASVLPVATPVPSVAVAEQPAPTNSVTSTSSPTTEPTVTPTPTPDASILTEARLSRVVDGDTIDVVVGMQTVRVRLIGMDTPETNAAPICYGQEATAHTRDLISVAGGTVWLEKDVSETDRYGRLLRYVWLSPSSGPAVGTMLDEQLVEDGYAQVSTFPPDVKYVDRFVAAERAAKAARRGLWGACERFGAPLSAPTPTESTGPAVPPTAVRGGGTGSNGNDGDLPYDPHGPDRDCSDFATHDEAQRFFIAAGGPTIDPHRLDGDHDGIACETLP